MMIKALTLVFYSLLGIFMFICYFLFNFDGNENFK